MYKIIGADGKEYGPVSAEQLRQWVQENRVSAQTLIQAESSADWRPLGHLPEFASLFSVSGAPPMMPSQSVPATFVPDDYELNLGGCLSRGWVLLKENMGLFIGVWIVYLLIGLALGVIGIIPFVGLLTSVVQIVLAGPLMGGLYWVVILRNRRLPATVGDLFAGFQRAFGNLILVQLVSSILAFIGMLPGVLLAAIGVFMAIAGKRAGSGLPTAGVTLAVIGGMLFLVGICVAIYLTVCWLFSLPLVVDRQISFWNAMGMSRAQVRKHWWGLFGRLFVLGLIGMVGTGLPLLAILPVVVSGLVLPTKVALIGVGCIFACIWWLFICLWLFSVTVNLYEDIFGRPTQVQ